MFVLVEWPQVRARAMAWKAEPKRHYYEYMSDAAFPSLVATEQAESWDDFRGWSNSLHGWGFRGQREASWTLQTSLERDAANGGIKVSYSYGNASGCRYPDRQMIEEKLLSGFRRLAPLHLPQLPADNDLASWLALMQHYGGPTRLLDWTECPFIGMYFALRKEPKAGNRSALWAIDLSWLERKARQVFAVEGSKSSEYGPPRIDYSNILLNQSKTPLVIKVAPDHANERMVAQKGFFLWKLYRETPLFDQMLMDMMLHPEFVQAPVIRKLEVSPELRSYFLGRLRQENNIDEARLFPGRDFCEPLRLALRAMVEHAKAEYEDELRSVQIGQAVHG
jgi:hypothetical protein